MRPPLLVICSSNPSQSHRRGAANCRAFFVLAPQVLVKLAKLRHPPTGTGVKPRLAGNGIQPALLIVNMTAFFIVLAIVAAGVITELVAANCAPFGYQDEHGFHFGSNHREAQTAFELENPS